MKTFLATGSFFVLILLTAPYGRGQFVPGPNPISGTVTTAQTISSGAGIIDSTGNLQVGGSTIAITVTGSCTIENDGAINQTGTGRGIRDNYACTFKARANQAQADQVIANAVIIDSGAKFLFRGTTQGALSVGTVLTVIANTSATPIAGTFGNLPDDTIFAVDGNHFQASYEGGDGNDLTLTVVP
jgi:hypothetical protein